MLNREDASIVLFSSMGCDYNVTNSIRLVYINDPPLYAVIRSTEALPMRFGDAHCADMFT